MFERERSALPEVGLGVEAHGCIIGGMSTYPIVVRYSMPLAILPELREVCTVGLPGTSAILRRNRRHPANIPGSATSLPSHAGHHSHILRLRVLRHAQRPVR